MSGSNLDLNPAIQSLLGQAVAGPPVPVDEKPSSIVGILGNALGGGTSRAVPMSAAEKDEAGGQALMNFGLNLLAQSGWTTEKKSLGQILGRGIAGAQESLHRSQAVTAAQRAALREETKETRADQLERLKTAIPLLKLQQEGEAVKRLGAIPPSIGEAGGAAAPGAGAPPALSGDQQTRAAAIHQGMVKRGWSDAAAWGFAANAVQESDANPSPAPGDGGRSHGVFQWNGPRLEAFKKKYGVLPSEATLDQQLDFANEELGGSEKGAADAIRNAKTPEEAAAAISRGYLRPRDVTTEQTRRAGIATRLAQGRGGAPAGVQVAGPGAPTGTLPPTPGAQPAPAPGDAPKPETETKPPPDPNAEPTFNYTPTKPPKEIIVSGDLTADESRVVQEARRAYTVAARVAATPEQRAQAEATLQATLDKELGVRSGRTKEASEALKGWYENDFKQQQEAYQKKFDAWNTRQTAEQERRNREADLETAHRRAQELAQQKARLEQETADANRQGVAVQDSRKELRTEGQTARGKLDDLGMLHMLSASAGTGTPLENIKWGDRTGRDYMVGLGLGTQAQKDKWGAQQAFQAAVNHTVRELAKGASMGPLTDADMGFLQRMAPDLLQSPKTRASIIALLEQVQRRKVQYTDKVEELYNEGKGVPWEKAKREAREAMPDYVPRVPDTYKTMSGAERLDWAKKNVPPGSFYRAADGGLMLAPEKY